MRLLFGLTLVIFLGPVSVSMIGCNTAGEKAASGEHADGDGHDHAGLASAEQSGHDHSSWWCVEHGVPEEECALCDTSLVAGFKAKGDWCEDHNRPESQCFVCNPGDFEKFAARYEAKYGERPPRPAE